MASPTFPTDDQPAHDAPEPDELNLQAVFPLSWELAFPSASRRESESSVGSGGVSSMSPPSESTDGLASQASSFRLPLLTEPGQMGLWGPSQSYQQVSGGSGYQVGEEQLGMASLNVSASPSESSDSLPCICRVITN